MINKVFHENPLWPSPHYHQAMEIVGRRWNVAIMWAMLVGASRFSEITAAVPNLSDRLCSARLKELEAKNLITRMVVSVTPLRIEYRLTDKGAALANVVVALSAWADKWLSFEALK
jgi:DNA-binding HxlR family transcriptional regulator